MIASARWALAVLFVVLVGTANAGGYRFGVSDQAFYVPAVALRVDATLFPRDRGVFEPQMRLWAGDELFGAIARATGVELAPLFFGFYLVTMAALTAGVILLARNLGCDWWTISFALVLMTLRHRIARTGANSLEGYMHPRMLAFACGLIALAFVVRQRTWPAAAWTATAALVHSSTALWFAGVVAVAVVWPALSALLARSVLASAGLVFAAGGLILAAAMTLPRMDAAWLAVLGDRDYLFVVDWPVWAWILNLAYPVVLAAVYHRRRAAGVTTAGEPALVAGLIALVLIFLATIPLADRHVAVFVQLQANRVFWLLDAVTVVYVAWIIAAALSAPRHRLWRTAAIGLLALAAIGRGAFVLRDAGRPLAQVVPAADDWTAVMHWLRTQPAAWQVLADPNHAWRYGSSLRAAALRDTPLEIGKDPAMAMYDRALAARVADAVATLGSFDGWQSADDVLPVAARYGVDVFVDRTDRTFPFPVLYRNRSFIVYDLR